MITAPVNNNCSTGLPLPKARWIPLRHRRPCRNDCSPPKQTTPTPTTPLPPGFEDTGSAFPSGLGDPPSRPVTPYPNQVVPEVPSHTVPAYGDHEWLHTVLLM